MKRLLIVFLLVAFFASVALAASRTWTSSDGRFRTEAELLGFADGKVRLKKSDGKVIEVPLESLSAADRRFVKQRYPESAAPGKAAGPKPPKPAPPKDDEEEAQPDDEADDPSESATPGPQEIEMKPLRLEPPKRKSRGKSASLAEYVLQLTQPQRIVQQGQGRAGENEFRQVVNKEPNTYFKCHFADGQVRGRSYGFASTAAGAKAVGYDRSLRRQRQRRPVRRRRRLRRGNGPDRAQSLAVAIPPRECDFRRERRTSGTRLPAGRGLQHGRRKIPSKRLGLFGAGQGRIPRAR